MSELLMEPVRTFEASAMSERERELAAILRAYSDVTDRLKVSHERLNQEVARLREELQRKNAELMRRDRLAALGEMAAGLAHEVRNPLGGIALYASMLERDLAGQEQSQLAASRISNGVRTLNRLVSDILDFAQEGHIERQDVTLDAILTDVEVSLRPWTDQTRGEVRIDEATRRLSVFCDAGKMTQVLLNLLLNGIQAAGEGGWVRLTARRPGGEAAYAGTAARRGPAKNRAMQQSVRAAGAVEIEIVDSGPGLAHENLDRIFNPFFTTKSTGTGLGLAIVHRIIEAHGGTIRAMNDGGGGAKFVIRLPDDTEAL